MRHTLYALLPAALLALAYWGMDAARVMALSIATAVATEAVCCRVMRRPSSVEDGNAVVIGLVFAFMLPAGAAWWVVLAGAVLGVGLGKMVFGGLGAHPVPAAAVGYAALWVCWSLFLDPDAVQLDTAWIDPLTRLRFFGAAGLRELTYWDMFAGRQLGGLGAANAGLMLLGGLYLAVRKVVPWQIPLGFVLGVAALSGVFWLLDPARNASPLFHILAGNTLLAAFFLATDPSSSPVLPVPMLLYGLLGGALTMLIRAYGSPVDGCAFAVLLACFAVPYFDLLRPKPFGLGEKTHGRSR